jgi:hypothetical protein
MDNRELIDLIDEAIHQATDLTDSEILNYIEHLLTKREQAN